MDLSHQRIEIHRNPRDGMCTDIHVARRGETISPVVFPDQQLETDRILA